nr:EamA family transporter [uncultured Ruegeria sp.]
MVTQLAAVIHAKPADVALVFNTEPMVSIAFAWVMLGETLSMVQMTGVALVIGAIYTGARLGASHPLKPLASKGNKDS